MNPSAIQLVKDLSAQGKSRDEIKAALVAQGTTESDASDLLDTLMTPSTPPSANMPPKATPESTTTSMAAPQAGTSTSPPLPAQAPAEASSTPSEWPGAFKLFAISRRAVRVSLGTIIWLAVTSLIVSTVFNIAARALSPMWAFVMAFVAAVISVTISAAQVYTLVSSARGQRMPFMPALSTGFKLSLKFFVLTLLTGISIVVSFLLLIVPAIFVLPRVALAPYFLVDQRLGILQAYKASWTTMKGSGLKYWAIIGVTILMVLPIVIGFVPVFLFRAWGLLFTLIGVLVTVYLSFMYSAALPLLYTYLTGTTNQE